MLSIITVNYNNPLLTIQCVLKTIESLKAHIIFEIIVVDNASTDNSFNILIEKLNDNKWVTVIAAEGNGGFGYGNNVGVTHAKYDNLWLLNSDAWCHNVSDFNKVILKLSEPLTGIVSTSMKDPDGTVHPNGGAEVSFNYFLLSSFRVGALVRKNKVLKKIVLKMLPSHNYSQSCQHDEFDFRETQVVSGASLLLTKQKFYSIGQFDTNFFLYDEDTDICFRMIKAGLKNYTTNLIEVQTINHSSTSKLPSPKLLAIKQMSRMYFIKKHFTGWRKMSLLYVTAVTRSLRN